MNACQIVCAPDLCRGPDAYEIALMWNNLTHHKDPEEGQLKYADVLALRWDTKPFRNLRLERFKMHWRDFDKQVTS